MTARMERLLLRWLRRRQAAGADGVRDITLDYPIRPQPRYGYGKPPHPLLHAILDRSRARYRAALEAIVALREDLWKIPAERGGDGSDPHWINVWLPGLDSAALYALLRERAPTRYFEIGSGVSTSFARRAIVDGALASRLVSIDPKPRRAIDRLCDRVIRRPLEDLDLALFDELEPGDVLFVDSSHYCFMNSDVTVLFLELLPRLRPGILVHLHDVCLPYDYPLDVNESFPFYSEQYLLAATLIADPDRFELVLANAFVSADRDLSRIVEPLWSHPAMAGVARTGSSFWFLTR